ncbi:MAG: hypothetical protein IJ468_01555 [Lachnospiraceae bacterium]|nr:hypothetical protein [Lachnospiraceae bacterium]
MRKNWKRTCSMMLTCFTVFTCGAAEQMKMISAAEAAEEISLYDMEFVAQQPDMTLRVQEGATDIYGTVYKNALTGVTSNVDNYADYVLDGAYDVFSGTVIRNAGTNPATDLKDPYRTDICVSVYGDGALLYQSQSVNLEGNEIQEFCVNVSGIKTLRISVNGKKYISVCDAVLSNTDEFLQTESESEVWSSLTQEYEGVTYTSMAFGDYGDSSYYSDKTILSYAADSEFIYWDDRVYYTVPESDYSVTAPIYSSALDGSDPYLIDENCDVPAEFVLLDGKIYFSRSTNYPEPSEIVCFDPETGSLTSIREGSLLCSGSGWLYVTSGNNAYRIDPDQPDAALQISAEAPHFYTDEEIVISEPESDGEGQLTYSVYSMETGDVHTVSVPDTYTGDSFDGTPYWFVGDSLFVYGNGMVSQYQTADGALVRQLAADSEEAFRYGQMLNYGQQYAAVFNEASWQVFHPGTNEWLPEISPAAHGQILYDWIRENCTAIPDFGEQIPQSAEELRLINRHVLCANEEAFYFAYETFPYSRTGSDGEADVIQNIWIVKAGTDGMSSVIGSTYWQ